MTTPTFPDIAPGRGSKRLQEHRVLAAKFGDGYGATNPDGINHIEESWSLSFKDYPEALVNTISDFITARGGTEHFLWTPPGESVAKKWKQTGKINETFPGHGTKSLTFTIKRVFLI